MVAAATDILSLADAKLQLRVDGDDHDALVMAAVSAAVEYVSRFTRTPLVDRNVTLYSVDRGGVYIKLYDSYVKEIVSFDYHTEGQDMNEARAGSVDVATLGRLEGDNDYGETMLYAPAAGWPTDIRRFKNDWGLWSVKLVYKRGYDPADHETVYRQAVTLMARQFYEQPHLERANKAVMAVLESLVDFR